MRVARVTSMERILRHAFSITPALVLALGLAAPAFAADSVPLPEPSTLTLLSLGAAGVLIGRRFSRKRPSED